MYNDLVHKIERSTKLSCVILVKYAGVGLLLPPLLVSFINYYILDLGDESFQNDDPMMYVIQSEAILVHFASSWDEWL